MSKIIHSCRKTLYRFTREDLCDCFWPHAVPPPERARTRERELEANDIAMLVGTGHGRSKREQQAAIDGIEDLLDQERRRRASVDSRLSAVISLATPANAFIVGIIAFLAGRETAFGATATVVVTFIGFYTVAQLLCAIRGAVHGLARRGYHEPTVRTKLRQFGEQQADHMLRQTRELVECLHDHHRHNNAKVTQMAVAHRAIKNAVVGFLLAIVVLFVSAVYRGCVAAPAGATTFRAEQSLRDAQAKVTTLERENAELKKQAEKLLQFERDISQLGIRLGAVAKGAIEQAANARKDADAKIRMLEEQSTEMRNVIKEAEQAKNELATKGAMLERENGGLKKHVLELEQAGRDADAKIKAMEQQIADLKEGGPGSKDMEQKQ